MNVYDPNVPFLETIWETNIQIDEQEQTQTQQEMAMTLNVQDNL
jgi:hypothetical protein